MADTDPGKEKHIAELTRRWNVPVLVNELLYYDAA
jgi:hypothetical protein